MAGANTASALLPRTHAMALEPRLMFDGAAAASTDPHHPAADAPHREATQATRAEAVMRAAAESAATAPAPASAPPRDLLVIDSRLAGAELLAANANPGVQVLMIRPGEDGLQAITQALQHAGGVDSIQILTHGAPGSFPLGSRTVSADDASVAASVGQWKGALSADADILLYGCRIGEGVEGQRLVQNLAVWTDADVAASDDDTGAATAGGDWMLETRAGSIEHGLALDAGILAGYSALLADATPTVQLGGGGDVLIGDTFTFTATFTNPSSQEGYAPYIDLFMPATGKDGDDGASFVSATYLGQAVTSFVLTFDAAGTAVHPLQRDANGQPVTINAAAFGLRAGDQLVVLELPYASVGADQPAIALQITARMSNLADTAASNGSPDLGIVARGGFQYGNDSLNNPLADPTLVQAGTSAIQVHPTVITLSQSVNAPEGKTATGENYSRQLTVTATPAPGQTLTGVVLEQDLPADIKVTAITPPAGGEVTGLVLADGRVVTGASEIRILLAAGAYVAHYTVEVPTLAGPASVVVDFHVPQPDATGAPILDPNSGAPVQIDIAAPTAGAEWVPLDPRDAGPAGAIDLTGTGQPVSFLAESIALYKQAQYSSDVGFPGPTPGDAFTYTLTLNLSDYYLFGISQLGQGNFVIYDAVGDGQALVGSPTMRVSLNGVDYTIALVTLTTNNPDGSTSVVFDVGLSLRNLFGNPGQLAGDIADDGVLQGATVVLISYTTIIAQAYTTPYPQSEINEGDPVGNDASVEASVLADRINTTGFVVTDGDSITGTVPVSRVDMAVIGVNGGAVPPNGELRPGDTVTFRLGYDLVTGDYENMVLTGYLPLPLFNVSGIAWTQGGASGQWDFGGGNTNTDPSVTVRSGPGNAVIFDFGNWQVNQTAGGSRIEVVFTLTVGDQPFADLRQLTILGTSDQTTTIDQTHLQSAAAATIQSIAEPSLLMYHGVVSSTHGTVTGTLGSWNAPGTGGAPFSGSLTDALAVNGNISGIDGGDRLRLATALENLGGGSAYDVTTDIALPAGVQFVGGSLASANLLVYRGDGTQLIQGVDFTVVGNRIEFIDSTASGALLAGRAGSANDLSGANVVVITYEVTVVDAIAASATMQSAATLTRYASVEGGSNFTQGDTERALQQVAAPAVSVVYAGGSLDNGDSTAAHTQGNALAIGEGMLYDIVVTLPEGSTQLLRIQDLVPDGLRLDLSFGGGTGYELITLVSGSGALSADFNGTVLIASVAGVGGIVGQNGVDGQMVFSRADAGADNVVGNNSFVIRVRLVADNNSGNQDGRTLANSAQLTYSDPDGDTPNGAVALERTVNRTGGTPSVVIREPTLVITQVTDALPPLGVDEAVPVTFQITLRNTGSSSDYNAFDIRFVDQLPSQMDGYTLLGVTFTGGASASSATPFIIDNGVLRVADGVKIDVPAGASIVIRVNGTVNDTAAGLPNFPNTAVVSWTSLDGTNAGERTGVDGLLDSGVLNDYSAASTLYVPVLRGVYVSRVGGLPDTAPANPTNDDTESAAIGEVVRYRAVGAFAQGVTGEFELRVTLPNGLGFINDGTVRIGLISDGGLTSSLNLVTGGALYISGDENSDQAQPLAVDLSGAPLTGVFDLQHLQVLTDANGNTVLVFRLGTITNNDADADFELYAVEFSARVLNQASNTAGTRLGVSADEYSTGTYLTSSQTVYEQIVEPAFSTLDKRVYDFNPVYSATTGRASVDIGFLQSGGQPAFNVVLTDAFPGGSAYTFTTLTIGGTTYTAGNLPPGVSVDTSNGIRVQFDQLDPGVRVSVRYDVTVPNQAAIANSNATLTWTSLPDDFTGWGGSSVGAAGTSSGERTGTGGSPNVYILQEGAGLGVISGTLWDDTLSATASPTPDGTGLAGQTVTLTWAGLDNDLATTADNRIFTVVTDANGQYRFGTLPSGVFRIDAPAGPLTYPQPLGELRIRIDSDGGVLGPVGISLGEGSTGQANAGYVHQNVAPINQVPGTQAGLEDVPLAIGSIAVSDIDAGTRALDVLLTVSHGTLSLSGTPANVTVTGSGTGSLRLSGSIADLNAALALLQYLGNQDYNGADTLTVTTSDQGNFGDADGNGTPGQPSDALTAIDTVAIVLDPVNDAPIGVDDVAIAVEAGGDNNNQPGTNPAGDMLANDIDVDIATNGDVLTVTQLRALDSGNVATPLPQNQRTALVGRYGTLYFYADGAFEYILDNRNPDVEALRLNTQQLFDTFTYDAVDTGGAATSAILSIVIHGANDAPVGVNDRGDAIERSGVANASGGADATGDVLANDTDVDAVANGETRRVGYARPGVETASGAFQTVPAGTTSSNGTVIIGLYGTLTLGADGSYRYVVDDSNITVQALMAGDELIDSFTYGVGDAAGLFDLARLDIHVAGANDNPVASDDVADAQAGSTDDDTLESNPSGNLIVDISRPGDPLDDGHDYDVDRADQPNTVLRVTGAAAGADQTGALGALDTTLVGLYGTLLVRADGSYLYNVDSSNAAVVALSAGQTLADVFTYEIVDSTGLTARANLTVTVYGAEDPPVAQNVVDVAREAGGAGNATPGENPTGDALRNSFDPDGDPIEVVEIRTGTDPAGGTVGAIGVRLRGEYGWLTLQANGDYLYEVDNDDARVEALRTPAQNLQDVFTFTLGDGTSRFDSAQIRIIILGQNDDPVAVADVADAVEAGGVANATAGLDPAGNVLDNDTDVDANDLHLVDTVTNSSGAGGTVGTPLQGLYGSLLLGADGQYVYRVDNSLAAVQALRTYADTLTEVYTYEVTDRTGGRSTATLTITLHGQNDAPVLVADSADALEAGGVANGTPGVDPGGNVLGNDTDVDAGDSLVVRSYQFGASSALSGQALAGRYGSLTLNADGSYSYVVDNANAAVQALRTSADTLVEVFTYLAADLTGATQATTLTITVRGANDAPVATNDIDVAVEKGGVGNADPGVSASGNLLGNDRDVDANDSLGVAGIRTGSEAAGGALTAVAGATVVRGTYGDLTLNPDGSYRYVLRDDDANVQALLPGEIVTDIFTYQARDAAGAVDLAQLSILVVGADDVPVAGNRIEVAVEAGGVGNAVPGLDPSGTLLDNVADVDDGVAALQFTAVSNGIADGTIGQRLQGQYGELLLNADGTFQYFVDNDNPAVQALRGSGDRLFDGFTYTVTDPHGASASAVLLIALHGQNDTPVARDDIADAFEAGGDDNRTPGVNPTGNVLLNDSDVDGAGYGETARVVAVRTGAEAGSGSAGALGVELRGRYGWLTLDANGSARYRLDNAMAEVQALRGPGDTLEDVFTYTLSDTDGATDQASITVVIHGANDAPVARDDAAQAVEAGGVGNTTPGVDPTGNVLDNDTDVDGPAYGEQLRVVSYRNGATVSLAGNVLAGRYGQLVINADGSFRYQVDNRNPLVEALRGAGDQLSEQFVYQIRDSAGVLRSATLVVTVVGQNDAPVAVDDALDAVEAGGDGNQLPGVDPSGNVFANDIEVDGSAYGETATVTAIRTGAEAETGTAGTVGSELRGRYGWLTIDAAGNAHYRLDNAMADVQALRAGGDTLTDVFTYTHADRDGAVDLATITVLIHGSNDAPVAVDDTAVAVEAGGVANTTPGLDPTGNVLDNDSDVDGSGYGEALQVVSYQGAGGSVGAGALLAGQYGQLLINADGSYRYVVDNGNPVVEALRVRGDQLSERFTYQVRDASGAVRSATLTVTVQGANDNPVARDDSGVASDQTPAPQVTGNVLPNDGDIDAGDARSVVAVRPGPLAAGGSDSAAGDRVAGRYGWLVLLPDGSYRYDIDLQNPEVLAAAGFGPILRDVFTYTIADREGATAQAQLTLTLEIGAPYIPVGGNPQYFERYDEAQHSVARLPDVQPAVFVGPTVERLATERAVASSGFGPAPLGDRYRTVTSIGAGLGEVSGQFVARAVAQSRDASALELARFEQRPQRVDLSADGLLPAPGLEATTPAGLLRGQFAEPRPTPTRSAEGFSRQLRQAADAQRLPVN